MQCATLDEILAAVPVLKTFGGVASGSITLALSASAGDTLTIGAAQLTGVNGPRTPGANNWSVDGTALQQTTDLLAALQDPLNEVAAFLTVSQPNPVITQLDVATTVTGPVAATPWSTSNPAAIVLDPLDGLTGGAAQLEFISDYACKMIGDCWGGKAKAGHILLTAHFAIVSGAPGAGGESGPASSKTIDKISKGYATTSFNTDDAAFASTRYGRQYLALRETVMCLPIVGRGLPGVFGRGGFGGFGRGGYF